MALDRIYHPSQIPTRRPLVLFLLRRPTKRHFFNEHELVRDVTTLVHDAPFDVQFVHLENYTAIEQYGLIRRTSILVGVHGAGLAWVGLKGVQQDLSVLEIMGASWQRGNGWVPPHYGWVSSVANARHQHLVQDDTPCAGQPYVYQGCIVGNASEIVDNIFDLYRQSIA